MASPQASPPRLQSASASAWPDRVTPPHTPVRAPLALASPTEDSASAGGLSRPQSMRLAGPWKELKVRVPRTETRNEKGKPITYYQVVLLGPDDAEVWSTFHRFSSIYDSLSALHAAIPGLDKLPGKMVMNNKDQKVIDDRAYAILNVLHKAKNHSKLRQSEAFRHIISYQPAPSPAASAPRPAGFDTERSVESSPAARAAAAAVPSTPEGSQGPGATPQPTPVSGGAARQANGVAPPAAASPPGTPESLPTKQAVSPQAAPGDPAPAVPPPAAPPTVPPAAAPPDAPPAAPTALPQWLAAGGGARLAKTVELEGGAEVAAGACCRVVHVDAEAGAAVLESSDWRFTALADEIDPSEAPTAAQLPQPLTRRSHPPGVMDEALWLSEGPQKIIQRALRLATSDGWRPRAGVSPSFYGQYAGRITWEEKDVKEWQATPAARFRCDIDCPVRTFAAFFKHKDRNSVLKMFDEVLDVCIECESLGPQGTICLNRLTSPVFLVAPREFCYHTVSCRASPAEALRAGICRERPPDNCWVMAAANATHPKVPEGATSHVRGTLNTQGYIVIPLSESRVRFTEIIASDTGGSIPKSLLGKAENIKAKRFIDLCRELEKYARAHPAPPAVEQQVPRPTGKRRPQQDGGAAPPVDLAAAAAEREPQPEPAQGSPDGETQAVAEADGELLDRRGSGIGMLRASSRRDMASLDALEASTQQVVRAAAEEVAAAGKPPPPAGGRKGGSNLTAVRAAAAALSVGGLLAAVRLQASAGAARRDAKPGERKEPAVRSKM
eukprot:TRINITY_DN8748_c0_g1_i3.p1 TRINITY_DN8748_c0_g1~~TRINITY_DN8748_c0_g1_i3.p1  ORF type:complete len:813 (+),score=212.12 TRINITY_DN8748_c0_g1_i3:92-2440(+)